MRIHRIQNTDIQIHRYTEYKLTEIRNTNIQIHRNTKQINTKKIRLGVQCTGLGGSTRNSKYLSTEASNQPDGVVATIKSQARL